MARVFLLSLLAIAAGLVLTVNLAQDPGYVLVVYGNYTFETSVFALLVTSLLLVLLLKIVLLLLSWLNPANLWRRRRQ